MFTDESDDGSGFYHDPPLWVGASPIDEETDELENLDSLVEVVYQTTMPCGVRISVTREGLFAFGFGSFDMRTILPEAKDRIGSRDENARSVLGRTLFMNAFLALVYTNAGPLDRMVVTPEVLMYIGAVDDPALITSSPSHRLEFLNRSNDAGSYNPNWNPTDDFRIRERSRTIRSSDLAQATDQLASFMSDYPSDGLLLLDLFARASKAYQDYSYSSCLITYWAIIEKLLGELWETFQTDNKTRNGQPFVAGQRLKRLQDGRTYTAAVIIEILSLTSYIDDELYQDISRIRKARNDWMHSLKGNFNHSDADAATRACERMFLQVRNLELRGCSPGFARY